MNTPVKFETQGKIGIIRIDNPPVNALSQAVMQGLQDGVARFSADRTLAALVIHADGRTFVAGADISEFSRPQYDIQPFCRTLAAIESLDRPVVASLHGTPLGGGLEVALACHYRIAHAKTRLGLPEVLIGVLPGAGGTQRLPRLAGATLALDMILSGRQLGAGSALDAGIVDEVHEGEPLAAAVAYAEKLVASGAGARPTRVRSVNTDGLAADFFDKSLAEATTKKAAYPAPQRIVKCVEAAIRLPFEEGMQLEGRLFEECRVSPQSAALRHLFFAEREAGKIPGLPKDTALRPIKSVGVVGAGTMGGGIAMNFANAGIAVEIVESSREALERGLGLVRKNYEASAAKGRMTAAQVEQRMALLHGSLDYEALVDCDLVIEAVFENLEIKKEVCAKLGRTCKPGAIIASNTSTLDVDVLAEVTGRPADVLGMHFFSPANVMRLLEVVRGAKTAPDVLATVIQLARTIKKVAAVSGVCYGFIGNRMLESYLRESEFLMMEGASPAQIDGAIEALGLAMGPCRMLDMAGLDVGAKVVLERGKAGGLPPDPSYRAMVRRMLEIGRHGQKTSAGYYRYEGRKAITDPEVTRIAEELAREHGIARRTDITDQEIVERCLYPLINEGACILEEGIAYRPGDIDIVWAHGYGFPDHRGGPIFMADQIGLATIAERLKHYAATRGNQFGYWSVSKLLDRLAADGKTLSGWKA